MAMDGDEEPRPSCNCKSTQCVQCYCQCFSNLWYCSDACGCVGCENTPFRESYVEEHVELKLMNRPGGFQPKIATDIGDPSSSGGEQRRHVKGCTCHKSKCAKNYCECFKNQVACTARCKCEGCANSHGARDGTKQLQENGDSGGSSGNSEGASGGANGSHDSSNGSAVVIDEESARPTEAGVTENIAAIAEPQILAHIFMK